MAILGIFIGSATVAVGIILKKRSGHKTWYILTASGTLVFVVSLFFMISTLLLAEGIQYQQPTYSDLEDEPVVDHWRVRRGYSDDYMVGDDMNVCFIWSAKDERREGWEVFDSSDGSLIQLLVPQDYPLQDFVGEIKCIKTGDYDGDEHIELGIESNSGAVLWYKWVPEDFSFEYIWTETGVSTSQNFKPYEAWAVKELTENQQALYREMKSKILAMELFSYDATTYGYDTLDDVFDAWSALKIDEPEIDNYFIIKENIDENGITLSLDSHYYCSWIGEENSNQVEISEGLKKFDQVCDDIISSMPKNASTYEKYRYLAQAVSKRADYDYSMTLPSIAAPYGIVTGQMICEGYAEAYQSLCKRADLWCYTVLGESNSTAHGWNLVWLDSGTYHVDITWADEQSTPGSKEWMRYFMLTQEEVLLDHIISDNTEATGSPLISQKEDENEQQISKEDAIDLVEQAMVSRNENASVIVLSGSEIIENEHCLTLSAGSYSTDGQKYSAMYHYAVSDSGAVYYIDVLQGADWILYQAR